MKGQENLKVLFWGRVIIDIQSREPPLKSKSILLTSREFNMIKYRVSHCIELQQISIQLSKGKLSRWSILPNKKQYFYNYVENNVWMGQIKTSVTMIIVWRKLLMLFNCLKSWGHCQMFCKTRCSCCKFAGLFRQDLYCSKLNQGSQRSNILISDDDISMVYNWSNRFWSLNPSFSTIMSQSSTSWIS